MARRASKEIRVHVVLGASKFRLVLANHVMLGALTTFSLINKDAGGRAVRGAKIWAGSFRGLTPRGWLRKVRFQHRLQG